MILIEASSNGRDWFLYGKKKTMFEAREAAAKCISVTNHTQVRITEEY